MVAVILIGHVRRLLNRWTSRAPASRVVWIGRPKGTGIVRRAANGHQLRWRCQMGELGRMCRLWEIVAG